MPSKKLASLPKADLAKIEAIRKKIEAMEKEMLSLIARKVASLDKHKLALLKAAATLKAKRA